MKDDSQLLELRRKIDAIDDDIVALLLRRSEVVHAVGELKRASGESGSYIRTDREAYMVRELLRRFEGSAFPSEAAVAVWRTIISASLSMESPLTLACIEGDHAAELRAQHYFSGFLPKRRHANAGALLHALHDEPHTVGIISLRDPQNWIQLATFPSLHIFAQLPVLEKPDDTDDIAFAIGQVTYRPCGDDIHFYVADAPNTPSLSDDTVLLAETHADKRWHGLLRSKNAHQSIKGCDHTTYIGSSAAPIRL